MCEGPAWVSRGPSAGRTGPPETALSPPVRRNPAAGAVEHAGGVSASLGGDREASRSESAFQNASSPLLLFRSYCYTHSETLPLLPVTYK